MRKIILPIILALIFFSGQCFAAEDYPICTKDENNFVKDFNLVSNKNFKLGTPKFLPTENNPEGVNLYTVDFNGKEVIVFTNKDNLVNRILFMTENKEFAKKFFNPALLAVGFTPKEIIIEPVFKKTETLKSVWCNATNRYVNVSTGRVEGNENTFFILILASKGE